MKTAQRKAPRASSKPATGPIRWTPGPVSAALFDEEQRYMTPGLQSIALLSKITIERGHGAILEDADGREYIDFVAGVCVASVGHAHPEYVRAISEQAARVSIGSFTTRNRLDFVKRLARVAPEGLDRVQLYSSGAEAVEAAVRLAKSRTKKFEVVSFWGGFHGKTGGVLGLLGSDFKHELGPLMPGLYSSPYPDPYRCPLGAQGPHDCAAHCLEFLRKKIKLETSGAVAAIIAEPIQGTAGNVIPPAGFLKGLREIADEIGALWISDEMITGFGRTGEWFGCQHEDAVPDIMTIGKGMAGGFPVSGVVASAAIASSKPFANPSGSSSSYGGNPLASAAANAAARIIDTEGLVENSRKVGAALLERLKSLEETNPLVGHVRGRGLMIGVELVKDKKSKEPLPKDACRAIFEEGLGRGLLTMAYSPAIRINPPLNIPLDLALRGADILAECLASAARRLGA
ncbi:MAG: aspartate aminotransferase family protein [Elusimicrobia bacterium]|nr:aspartate aminotransferase family protein [Elusimicrobiota bacterium]